MPISGIVIRIDVDRRAEITEQITALDGVELTQTPPGDTLVAVIESTSMAAEEELFTRVADLPGVTNVTMSYHNFEDLVNVDH